MKSYFTKALFLTGFIFLLSFNSVSASTNIEGTYAKDAIGNFNPTSNITRQDFALILAKSLKLDTSSSPGNATFSDVPINYYSYANVEDAIKAGLISGKVAGKLGTSKNLIEREQVAIVAPKFIVKKSQ